MIVLQDAVSPNSQRGNRHGLLREGICSAIFPATAIFYKRHTILHVTSRGAR